MIWTSHTTGGPKGEYHNAVIVGNTIYSLGGYEKAHPPTQFNVYILNNSTYTWEPVCYSDYLLGCDYTAVGYKDKIYVWGTLHTDEDSGDYLACFDPNTVSWCLPKVTGTGPSKRKNHSACVIKNNMYVFGGIEDISNEYTNDVYCLNLDTFDWRHVNTKGTLPSPRHSHTAVTYDERMYIFGGECYVDNIDLDAEDYYEELYSAQVFFLDTTTETWVNVNARGTHIDGRNCHSSWIYKDFMYVYGGDTDQVVEFTDLYRYSIKGNYWEMVNVYDTNPSILLGHSCVLYENKAYLFGGSDPDDEVDLYILDLEPTLKKLCMLSVIKHKLDQSRLSTELINDLKTLTCPD